MNNFHFGFSGFVGQDAELKYLQNGTAVLNVNVAVSDGWFDKQANEWKDRTHWVRVAIWGEAAERAAQRNIRKGQLVMVEDASFPIVKAFTNNSGQPAASLEVTARGIRAYDVVRNGQSNGVSETAPAVDENIPF